MDGCDQYCVSQDLLSSSLTLTHVLAYEMEVTLLLPPKPDVGYIFACFLKEMGLLQSHNLLDIY